MTYWHMQLHEDNKNSVNELEILEKTSLIGLGYWESGNSQISDFKNKMNIDDIVVIRKGKKVIALVSIEGECIDKGERQESLDWFQFRRKIKILDIARKDKEDFPYLQGTLKSAKDKDTPTYKYIYSWYNEVLQKDYNNKDLIENTYKVKNIYIEQHKMFKHFSLDLLGEDNIPVPIVVIAGKNGTGKTTLLEYLAKYDGHGIDYVEIFETRKPDGIELFDTNKELIVDIFKIQKQAGIQEKLREYKKHIKYMKVEVNNLGDIEEYISDFYIDLAEQYDSFSKALEEVKLSISNAFSGLDLNFNVSKINYKEKKVFFIKDNTNVELSMKDLSTGEKTLLSKVLALFFEKVKNKIILIDEPELSLHPRWQNSILKIYENYALKNNCQIIIATHSPHIIGSAKNEYIRVFREIEGNIEVINDLKAYGRDIEWVLQQMGVENLRVSEILDKFTNCQQLLNDEKYNEAEECINSLEEEIGQNDRQIMNLRNSLFFERD